MKILLKKHITCKKSIVLIIALILISTNIFCQQLAFKKYTSASGLTSNYIFDLFQDRDGFIWIATDHGVSRFDGKNFTNFTYSDGLAANYVYKIFQSIDGALWFGTFRGGVSRFDNNSFETINEKDGLINNIVSEIVEDKYGRLYFMTDKGLSIYKDSIIISFDLNIKKGADLYSHPSGKILFNGNSKLYILNPTERNDFPLKEIQLTPKQREALYNKKSWASPILWKNNTLLFPGRAKCLEIQVTDSFDIKSISVIDNTFFALFEDHVGRLWAAERNGVKIISDDTTRILSKKDGLNPDYIEDILEDKEGNIWLGTFGGGLYKYKGDYLKYYNKESGLPSNIVTSLSTDLFNNVYVGTTNGIASIKRNGSVKQLLPKNISSEIQTIDVSNNNNLFYTTFEGLHGPINLDNPKPTFYNWNIKSGISSIFIDEKNEIWVSSYGDGLFRFRENNLAAVFNNESLISYTIEDIVKGNNSFWLLTRESGAIKVKKNSFLKFSEENDLPSNAVYSLFEEKNGDIWFGTDNGIAKYFEGNVRTYATKNELIGNYVIGIFKYFDKVFFITDKALHFNKIDKLATYLGSSILPNKDVGIQNYLFSNETGILWLGTNDGVIRIDLNEVEKQKERFSNIGPNIVLTSVSSDTTKLYKYSNTKKSLDKKKETLTLSQNTLNFHFTGISFSGELPIHYQFCLDGEEKVCSELTTYNEVTYRNLSSGEYTFSVYAINALGVASKNSAKYSFIITPPYWEKLWFIIPIIIFGIIILILLVYFLSTREMRQRIKRLKQKQALQEVKLKTRERIAGELHDDVSSTLSSISLFAESLKKKLADDPEKTEHYLSRLNELTREAQSTMEEVVWELSPHNDTIQDLILRIGDFSTVLCWDNNIKCFFQAPEIKDNFDISEKLRKNIYLILKETLNNILKHSKATEVIIKIDIENNNFVLIISDNGNGFTKNDSQKTSVGGHGLINMNARANQIDAQLSINSKIGEGTKIILKKQITQMRY